MIIGEDRAVLRQPLFMMICECMDITISPVFL